MIPKFKHIMVNERVKTATGSCICMPYFCLCNAVLIEHLRKMRDHRRRIKMTIIQNTNSKMKCRKYPNLNHRPSFYQKFGENYCRWASLMMPLLRWTLL